MRFKTLIFTVIALALIIVIIPQDASASFAADTGALCMDSLYFKDRGFDSASAMLASAKDIFTDSFVLVFYSRYNEYCQDLLPQIQTWAENSKFPVYGIDQYNKYTRQFGYFNTKTSLEGWEEYINKQSFSFPAVFIYNADTRKMTAADEIYTLSAFTTLLNSAGMLGDPYHDYASAGRSSVQLSQLELLLGTGTGFDLLRSPTRAEALTMLIRLLGKEDEALLSDLPHPFTDVPSWASPYVGFAYHYGITRGISDTAFDSASSVTSAEFLTFVLRALGYTSGENGDFAWDDPYALSYSVGILPPGVNTKEFLRADMTVICRNALDSTVKNENITLVQKLVNQRALNADTLQLTLGISAEAVSARHELENDYWSSVIEIEKRSPLYVLEAMSAAAYQHPDVICVSVPAPAAINWGVYLAEYLSFPADIVSSYEMLISGESIYIIPEYTMAAGAFADLTLNGYDPTQNEAITANFIKANLSNIVSKGAETWAEEYFLSAEILPDTEQAYSNVDAALILKRCTAEAIEKAKQLLAEIEQNAHRIK